MNDYISFIGYMTDRTIFQWEGKEFSAQHHSTYQHTINFFIKGLEPNLLSIGYKNVEGSPYSIYCPDFNQLSQYVTDTSICAVQDNQLIIDGRIRIVCLIIPEQVIEPTSLEQLNQTKLLGAKQITIQNILKLTNPYKKNASILPFYNQLMMEKKQLLETIQYGDFDAINYSLNRLIGLGVGLTPSGDDYLTGLILSQQLVKKQNLMLLGDICSENREVKSRTNDVSSQQLYFACIGRSKQRIISLINAIKDDGVTIQEFERQVFSVLSIGSTSGFDLLLGISDGIELIKKK